MLRVGCPSNPLGEVASRGRWQGPPAVSSARPQVVLGAPGCARAPSQKTALMGGATAQVDGAAGPALAGGDAQHAAADSRELAHAKPISAGSSRADTPVAEQGAAARPIPEGVPVARTPADAPAAETSDGEAEQVSQTQQSKLKLEVQDEQLQLHSNNCWMLQHTPTSMMSF